METDSYKPQGNDSMAAATGSVAAGVALTLGGAALLVTAKAALVFAAGVLAALSLPACALGSLYIIGRADVDGRVRSAYCLLTIAVLLVSAVTLLTALESIGA